MSAGMLSQNPPCYQALLDLHNNLRARVARGEEGVQVKMSIFWFLNISSSLSPPSQSKLSFRCQPGASNMQQLVWSEELARIAQTWADQCDCVFQQNQVGISDFELLFDYGLWIMGDRCWHTNSQRCTYCCKLKTRAI